MKTIRKYRGPLIVLAFVLAIAISITVVIAAHHSATPTIQVSFDGGRTYITVPADSTTTEQFKLWEKAMNGG